MVAKNPVGNVMTDRSAGLPMFQDSAIDCLAVYGIDYTDKSFFCYRYHGNVLEYCAEKQGYRRATYILLIHLSLPLV